MMYSATRLQRGGSILTQAARSFSSGNSVWGALTAAPADPILGLNEAFKKDTDPRKQLLGMGAYRCDKGKPYILDCVRKSEERILARNTDHEYTPIDGSQTYRERCATLALGENSEIIKSKRFAGCQTISGTGSLRVGLTFLKDWFPNKNAKVYVPDPTWPTHRGIAEKAGYEWVNYRYYDKSIKGFNLNGMLEDLDKAEKEQIVILHSCAHNPTGCDPTEEQWKQILEVVKRKNHFVGFDTAYQGFSSGNLDKDAYSLRLFSEHTDRLCLFQSFAKNFGLYGERAGCLVFAADSEKEAQVVSSRIKMIARPMYSSPPVHGARIVDEILGDAELTKSWHQDLIHMSSRMAQMRSGLVDKLKEKGSTHDWSHVITQIGMFAYTGLSTEQVNKLREDYHIYMTGDGRISIAGLNTSNLDYVAEAFHNVSKDHPL
uniref:Aspartate aminotransferase n=1 Tax=Strombidium rassoulzadegani TaxID=1082188 RepID=A0A7S3FUM4_9SPIT|mmetsp:Transcript_17600/g.29717  ORF Transcript_17600/g.29717 Transcript_17600/m.29717 type:complete len:432 (+) Transcript_17600:7-1302(+)